MKLILRAVFVVFIFIFLPGCNTHEAYELGYTAGKSDIQTMEANNGVKPGTVPGAIDGWICFIKSQDIWVMRTDGSQPQNITGTESMWEVSPMLSWDGSRIAYTDLDNNLYVINRDGTNRQTLLENAGAMHPSWSPNGKEIVYIRMNVQDGDGVMSIHILDIESKEDTKIYEKSPEAVVSPVMSPDGDKIAFSSGGLYTIGVDGSNLKEILGTLPNDQMIFVSSWSKDGQKIAFHTSYGITANAESWAEYADIYTIDVDGSGLANLTHSTPDPSITLMPGKNIFQMSYTPKWTYDNQIVFWSNQNSGSYTFKPYIMNSDGSSVELLVDQEVQALDYQPDPPPAD